MAITLSTQMSRSLLALIETNKDIEDTQLRMNTGKRINSSSDDIAVYFRARAFSEKATLLDTVNEGITQAVANLDFVDKALDNMQKSLKGALQVLKDARAKAMPAAMEAKATGDQDYANVGAITNPTTGAVLVAAKKGDLVSARALGASDTAANIDSATMFQVGDVVAVSLQDGGKTVTKYFRAVDPNTPSLSNKAQAVSGGNLVFVDKNGNTVSSEGAADVADGSSSTLAMGFRDLASFGDAIQKAFGYDTLTVNVNQTTSGSWKMGFNMAAGSSASLSFAQVNDQVVGRGAGNTPDAGGQFNFATLLGKQSNAAGTRYDRAVTLGTATIGGQTYNNYTYDPTGPTQSAINEAQLVRSDAASFLKQTVYGLSNTAKDAYLPGYANLLKGETMTVIMNDVGDVTQSIKPPGPLDAAGLGFEGYRDTNGVVSLTATSDEFRTDAKIQSAIDQTNAALTSLSRAQGLIAGSRTAMASRLELNKIMSKALEDGANTMTAADATEEAVKMAVLQNRQAFAAQNLNVTRQSEQYLLNLLR